MINPSDDKLTVRVFFALWPAAGESRALAEWQTGLKDLCGGRLMRPDTLHVTLLFLGDMDMSHLEVLIQAVSKIRVEKFKLCFDQARYWEHNHILYAAPGSVPDALQKLVGELRLCMPDLKAEQFNPHVTLLRNALCSDVNLPKMSACNWQINDFVLVQSAPLAGVANYLVLARFPLLAPILNDEK